MPKSSLLLILSAALAHVIVLQIFQNKIFQNNPRDKKAPDRTDTYADSWVASCLNYHLRKGTE